MVLYKGKCERCEKDYSCYVAAGRKSRFCSKKCMIVLEHHGEKNCETCGKNFKWYRGKTRNEPRFCSHSCQGSGVKEWRSKHKFSWKGKTEEEKLPMMKIMFYERIEKTESCWIWKGSKIKSGYGIISFGGKPISAHRLSWKIHHEEIGSDMIVRHLCNNPICVNPEHLAIGTHQDNSDDRVKAGNSGKGSQNCNSSLNEEDIKKIKNLLVLGISGAEIGRRFNVSRTTINNIKKQRTWRHVN